MNKTPNEKKLLTKDERNDFLDILEEDMRQTYQLALSMRQYGSAIGIQTTLTKLRLKRLMKKKHE